MIFIGGLPTFRRDTYFIRCSIKDKRQVAKQKNYDNIKRKRDKIGGNKKMRVRSHS